MQITAFNPSTDNLEKSYLSSSYAAGVTEIKVRNADNYSADDRILIGEQGSEQAEIVTVSTVDADQKTLTIDATLFPHSASVPVFVLRYDQIKFYRSTSTIDGSYDSLATVNIDVDNQDKKTRYEDSTGLPAYFYKISFYHSESTVESSLSDPIPGSGYTRKQVGTIVADFLTEIGDSEQEYMNVPQIISLMNEVNDDLIGHSRRPYRALRTSTTVNVEADNDRIALPDDLVKFDRARYTNEESTVTTKGTKPVISMEEMEMYKYNTSLEPAPLAVGISKLAIDETTNELVLYPTPTTDQDDAIEIFYWKEFDEITSLSDEVETPTGHIYKLFLLARYYLIRAKKESSFLVLSDRYEAKYSTEVVKLQRSQKVDVGTPPRMKKDTRTNYGLRR